ncbi:MAG TPA: glycosyltransferase [Solirubrobacteraceae bacterium]|nr:glycosyltransferase [Solirubrobacteraceae bacterium]
MTTKAGAGHFGPLIPFARAFQRAGAEVLIAAPREAAPMVRAEGLPLWAFDDPPAGERDAIFASIFDGSADASPERVVGDIFARIDARAAFPGVLAACQAWGPDVVVSEITEFAGPLAAETAGVPSVCVGLSQQGREDAVVETVLPAIDELRARFGLAPDPAGERILGRPYFTLMPAALEDPATPARYPALRFREARPAVRRHPLYGGPADDRPMVYVTFGSVAPTMDFFPGLYRAAVDALAGLPVRLLVTVGRDRDPAELGPVPANVRVERWVPQADLMPHVAAMVCHGGSGTVTMGLAAGVPMAVVPLFADQPWNAERVAALGAGVQLEGGPEAVAGLRDAVVRLTGDPSYRSTAQRVAAEMRALPPVDAAVGVVRGLLIERRHAA